VTTIRQEGAHGTRASHKRDAGLSLGERGHAPSPKPPPDDLVLARAHQGDRGCIHAVQKTLAQRMLANLDQECCGLALHTTLESERAIEVWCL
jgi:hypothetical protein